MRTVAEVPGGSEKHNVPVAPVIIAIVMPPMSTATGNPASGIPSSSTICIALLCVPQTSGPDTGGDGAGGAGT
jgi:hypothetical protein